MASNDNGIWLNKETGKVVKSKPSRGRQIVAPGREVTANLQNIVDLYEANSDTTAVETATAPPAVETRTTTKKATTPKKAASKKKDD